MSVPRRRRRPCESSPRFGGNCRPWTESPSLGRLRQRCPRADGFSGSRLGAALRLPLRAALVTALVQVCRATRRWQRSLVNGALTWRWPLRPSSRCSLDLNPEEPRSICRCSSRKIPLATARPSFSTSHSRRPGSRRVTRMSSSSARRSAPLSLIRPPQPVLLTTARVHRPPQLCRRLRGGRHDPGLLNSFVEGHPPPLPSLSPLSPLPSRPLPSRLLLVLPLPSRPLLVLLSWPLLLPSSPRYRSRRPWRRVLWTRPADIHTSWSR